jgi:hypothetical protein
VWERACELFAFAISTGLHQNPTKIDNTYGRDQSQNGPVKPKTTPYEREMRRRLWATIVEIEMQASIDKGVPSSRLALLADCGPPQLLNDDVFGPSSTELPLPSARDTYTATSYLHISQESLRLRSSLADLINTGMDDLTNDEVLTYDERIKTSIERLPSWVRDTNNGSPPSSVGSLSAAALLELQLLQFQFLLHIPYARRVEQTARANFSRIACVEASNRILDIHLRLAQPSLQTSPNHWLNLLREDIFRSIIGICYNLVVWRGLSGKLPIARRYFKNLLADLAADGLASVWMKDLYTKRASEGLELFKRKVLCLGDHYVQLWYTLAGVGMLQACFDIVDVNTHVTKVAHDLTGVFEEVCNSQEEVSNEHTAAGALTALATPSSGAFDAGTPLPMPDMSNGQSFLDGTEMNAWGFDDLWPFSSTGLSW